ncbi:DNA topoisomerase III [Carnimonas bestiolae]|uniref:DNA topoisomerase III n=1 Tax=Carnimonas bestiolae TaxID=3402172 RepID=UPI003EDC3779
MTTLYICEKPSQARDIAKVLGATTKSEGSLTGNGITVTWGFGHLLEQAPPDHYDPALKKWSFDTLPIVPAQWKLLVTKTGAKQFAVIKKLLKQATDVVISTDADREGESIGREILDACRYRGNVRRLWLSALDDASIRKALSNIRSGDSTWPLYQAALGRSRADWLIGMNMTRAFSLLAGKQGYQGVLSVGRVQTPTLALVVHRDAEIARFVPKPFWNVVASLQASSGSFSATWQPTNDSWLDDAGRGINQQAAAQVAERVTSAAQAVVTSVETTRKKEQQPLVMDLGTLQQECSKRWGYGAQQVLDIAQSLYETHKATTYPRTDCRYLPTSQQTDVPAVLTAIFQSDGQLAPLMKQLAPSLKSRVWNDSKITAHHGIIPTTAPCDMGRMSETERNVYDLIRRYYLAQFLPAHEYDQTEVVVNIAGERFAATGRQIRSPGWKVLFPRQGAGRGKADATEGADDKQTTQQELPVLQQGENCAVESVDMQTKQTTPPSPYTEGTLIAAMKNAARFVTDERLKARLRETSGIGTEATRAPTIDTLKQRGFIKKQGKSSIVSTPTGQALIHALPQQLSNPGMTALWEQALDMVAEGNLSLDDFMSRQTSVLNKLLDVARQGPSLNLPAQPTETCPLCQSAMKLRKGAKGPFWSCSKYPQCQGTKPAGKKHSTSRKSPSKGSQSRRPLGGNA